MPARDGRHDDMRDVAALHKATARVPFDDTLPDASWRPASAGTLHFGRMDRAGLFVAWRGVLRKGSECGCA